MNCITINTDASFCPNLKVGTYAFWIVSDGLLLKGSGIFKSLCTGPTDVETKSICNAVAILLKCDFDFSRIQHVVFNRDNVHAKTAKKGHPVSMQLHHQIRLLSAKCANPKVSFRHVRAHTGKPDGRSRVNEWCDEQCKIQLKKAREFHSRGNHSK